MELNSFSRQGSNLFIQWDPEDPNSDVYVLAALSCARALCVRQARLGDGVDGGLSGKDLAKLDRCLADIEKHARNMDDIEKHAKTIENANLRILKRVELDRAAILARLHELAPIITSLKAAYIDKKGA